MKVMDEMKDIHNALYDALCYLDDFCRNHNLTYFLSNGTLLGAAKYGDFIPWDDDVDVLMPREDYDRLMAMTDVSNDTYRLLCVEQVPAWRMPYAKLSCEKTILREGEYDFGASFGLSVDIFPIDNWSPCLGIARWQAFRSECLKRCLVCSIGGEFRTKKTGVKRMILKAIWGVGKRAGHAKLQRTLLKQARRANRRKPKYRGCRAWTCHMKREIFPAAYFSQASVLTFRGREFPVIARYEAYLSSLYGNWRAELPKDQQHSNHEIQVWYKDAE